MWLILLLYTMFSSGRSSSNYEDNLHPHRRVLFQKVNTLDGVKMVEIENKPADDFNLPYLPRHPSSTNTFQNPDREYIVSPLSVVWDETFPFSSMVNNILSEFSLISKRKDKNGITVWNIVLAASSLIIAVILAL